MSGRGWVIFLLCFFILQLQFVCSHETFIATSRGVSGLWPVCATCWFDCEFCTHWSLFKSNWRCLIKPIQQDKTHVNPQHGHKLEMHGTPWHSGASGRPYSDSVGILHKCFSNINEMLPLSSFTTPSSSSILSNCPVHSRSSPRITFTWWNKQPALLKNFAVRGKIGTFLLMFVWDKSSPGADPEFWSEGDPKALTPGGQPWAQNMLKIGVFPFQLPEIYMILKKSWGQGGPRSPWIR